MFIRPIKKVKSWRELQEFFDRKTKVVDYPMIKSLMEEQLNRSVSKYFNQ